jgi:hypothetical protein
MAHPALFFALVREVLDTGRGRVGCRLFARENKNRVESEIDGQQRAESCDRVTGCTPQAFHSVASLDGPVDDNDDDDGHPCLKHRAIPSHYSDTLTWWVSSH